MMIRGCLSSNHHHRASLMRKFLKPTIVSYADPAHHFDFRCANFFFSLGADFGVFIHSMGRPMRVDLLQNRDDH